MVETTTNVMTTPLVPLGRSGPFLFERADHQANSSKTHCGACNVSLVPGWANAKMDVTRVLLHLETVFNQRYTKEVVGLRTV